MEISIAIVTFNNMKTIPKCISSIYHYKPQCSWKFYVIDNHSADGTPEWIKEHYPNIQVIQNKDNIGFGRAHNLVIPLLSTDYHFIINPDIEIKENVFDSLIEYMERNLDVYMVTPEIRNPDESVQYLPKREPTLKYIFISKIPFFNQLRKEYTRQSENLAVPMEIDFCTGSFFCIRSQLYREIKGFDDRYFMYFEDADLSKKLTERKCRIVYYPLTKVYHEWHRENTKNIKGMYRFVKSMVLYFVKWGWRF